MRVTALKRACCSLFVSMFEWFTLVQGALARLHSALMAVIL
jgi:hypothetical protein